MYTINLYTGTVIRTSDGVQVAPTQSETDENYLAYIEWISQGNQPTEVNIPISTTSRKLSKLGFRNRFTSAEKVALEMASLDNPSGTIQQRQLSATLRVYLKDLETALFIDLDRQDTQYGVNVLVQLGLITSDRAYHILNDVVQPHEAYYG